MTSLTSISERVAGARSAADECVAAFDTFGRQIHPEADIPAAIGEAAAAFDATMTLIAAARFATEAQRVFTDRAVGGLRGDGLALLGEFLNDLDAAERRLKGAHTRLMVRIRGVRAFLGEAA